MMWKGITLHLPHVEQRATDSINWKLEQVQAMVDCQTYKKNCGLSDTGNPCKYVTHVRERQNTRKSQKIIKTKKHNQKASKYFIGTEIMSKFSIGALQGGGEECNEERVSRCLR